MISGEILNEGTPGLKWGGGTVLILKLKTLILSLLVVDAKEISETIILAAVGATVGFFVHLLLSKIFKKK